MKKVGIFVFFLLAIGYQLLTTNIVYAQNTQTVNLNTKSEWYEGGFGQRGKALDAQGNNAEKSYNFAFVNLVTSAGTALSGFKGNEKSLGELQRNIAKSALGQTGNMMAILYNNPPTTTSEYFADVFNRAGLVPKTYAQGISYSRLLPILPIWKILRDLAYLCMSIVMLMIGVMIMFRHKVNAQTVANIENTIPNVIKTIILITFSFPIAALMIDIMYVAIAAGVGIIGSAVGDKNVTEAIKDFTTGGFWALFGHILSPAFNFLKPQDVAIGATGAVGIGIAAAFALHPVGWIIGIVIAIIVALGGISLGTTGADVGSFIAGELSPILFLCVLLVLFFSIFRVFFILLMSYIQILVYIVFAPLLLLFNAIPGQDTFSNWWKNIAMNLSSFVTTAIIMYLGWAITFSMKNINQPLWTAPFIIQGVGAPQMAGGLIALAFSITLPQWIQKVRDKFNVKPVIQVGPSMLTGPVTSAVGQGWGLASNFLDYKQRQDLLEKFMPGPLKKVFKGITGGGA